MLRIPESRLLPNRPWRIEYHSLRSCSAPPLLNQPIDMTDHIVQEVRDIRAELASRFDYDLARIIDDAMERQAKSQLPTNSALEAPSPSPVARKRRARPARVSA